MTENRTLILEDNPSLRNAMVKVAKAIGFTAETAATPAEFYAQFAAHQPALVVLDVVLGEGDVCEVIDFLGRSRSPARVILMSGFDYRILHSVAKLAKGRGLHVVDVIEKRADASGRLAALLRAHAVGPLPAAGAPGEPA